MTDNSPQPISQLQTAAITAAKKADWAAALQLNQNILDQSPDDLAALNRLGLAHAQLGEIKAARTAFEKALQVDKYNSIAKKHLATIKDHDGLTPPSLNHIQFIEEPGRTKVVDLHRLAGRQVMHSLGVGTECQLVIKKRYISIEVNGTYLGALPEDLSFRLSKLMRQGNKYVCYIRSINSNSCAVYLKEIKRSKKNSHLHSFPPGKVMPLSDDLDENIMVSEDEDFVAPTEDDTAEEEPSESHREYLGD